MAAGQSGRDARLDDGCFAGYYASHKPGQAVGKLSTTVVNSKALWHHALFDDIGGDDAKNGGPEDG
jgi:hypothetical protein